MRSGFATRRSEFPSRLGSVAACRHRGRLKTAAAKDRVAAIADPMDAGELAELLRNYGEAEPGRSEVAGIIGDQDRRRVTATVVVSCCATNWTGSSLDLPRLLYRDVLAVTTLAHHPLIQRGTSVEIDRLAAATDMTGALGGSDAIRRAQALLADDGTEDLVFGAVGARASNASRCADTRVKAPAGRTVGAWAKNDSGCTIGPLAGQGWSIRIPGCSVPTHLRSPSRKRGR